MSQNICAFVGRLTDKPAGGQTRNNNRSSARFDVAVQRNYKNQNGDYDADFIKCWVFGHGADYLMQYAGQGDTVSISGELRQNRWTDQQGNKRSELYVLADQVSIVAHPQKSQVSWRHYESQQQSYQNNQQPSQTPHGQQQTQYAQQTMNTGNGWGETSAGQKREQVSQQNNQPVEINDNALPFNHGSQSNNSNLTNEDDLPF